MKRVLLLLAGISFLTISTATAQFWERLDGPYGSMTPNMYQTARGTMFADTWHGIYRSTNDGLHWEEMLIDDKRVIFGWHSVFQAGQDSVFLVCGYRPYLYVSTDEGKSWANIWDDPYAFHLANFETLTADTPVLMSKGGRLYLGTLTTSTDLGYTWEYPDSPISFPDIMLQATDSTILYAGFSNPGGIALYQENADTWLPIRLEGIPIINVCRERNGDLYAQTESQTNADVIFYRSTDNGFTWEEKGSYPLQHCDGIACAKDGTIYAINPYQLVASTDSGTTWSIYFEDEEGMLHFENLFASAIDGINIHAFNRGMYHSSNGTDIELRVHGLFPYMGQVVECNDRGLMFGTNGGLWKTTDYGTTFNLSSDIFQFGYIPSDLEVNPLAGTIALSDPFGHFSISSDNGNTWEILWDRSEDSRFPYSMGFGSDGTLYFGAGDSKLYYSVDDNRSREYAGVEPPSHQDRVAFVETGDGYVIAYRGKSIYRFNQSQKQFEPLANSDGISFNVMVAVDNVLLGASSKGIYRSADHGDTWTFLTTLPSESAPNFGTMLYVPGTGVYAGDWTSDASTTPHLYLSTDRGESWEYIPDTLNFDFINEMILASDGRIYAATSMGLVRSREVVVSAPALTQPSAFSLSPAYPNPFTGSTTITYSLPAQQHILLDVYNALGRKVQTLYNGLRDPGTHTVRLDASMLPAGTYRVTLKSGNSIQTQLVVVQ